MTRFTPAEGAMTGLPSVRPGRVPRRIIAAVRVSRERDGMTSPEVQRYSIKQKIERDGDRIIDWIEGIG